MPQGSLDLLILLIIFLGLQIWWIYPLIKKKRLLNKETTNLKEKIETLEKVFKQ